MQPNNTTMIDHVIEIILAHAAGATRTPEEAITVLNVLPCHDAVLSATLSRGFLEFNPALAIKHGHGLALLPHYPAHVLIDDLYETLKVAFTLGHLPTIELLWKLAGPNSCGRLTWAEHGHRFVDLALASGSLDVLDWFDRVATEANFEINWDRASWYTPAQKGLFHVFRWGIEHGHLKALTPALVLESAQSNDLSLICGWLADQPDMADAIATLKSVRWYSDFLKYASINTLEWWWTHIAGGSELPEPETFAEIVDKCLSKQDTAFLEWWWALFLQHRTPEHTFGTGYLKWRCDCWRIPITNAEWLWHHSHSSGAHWDSFVKAFAFAPDWHDLELPDLIWLNDSDSVDLVRWWAEKCYFIGRKLVVSPYFVERCGKRGHVSHLEYVLQFHDKLEIEQSIAEITNVLKDIQQTATLPKDIVRFDENDSWDVPLPNFDDGDVEELKALYAGTLEADRGEWKQQVCEFAIEYNMLRIQNWLLSDPVLMLGLSLVDKWFHPTLYTLEFASKIAPGFDTADLARSPLGRMILVHWKCAHNGISVESLLPLDPQQWHRIFMNHDLSVVEWWLQLHFAGGHPLKIWDLKPLSCYFSYNYLWLKDVIARGIPTQTVSSEGVYEPLTLSMIQEL